MMLWPNLWRLIRGLAFAALGWLAAGLPAIAQSPMCMDLQRQYMSLLATKTSGGGAGQRMVQMDQLSRELANAQMAARQGNCNRFLFFGPRPSPQCPAIHAAVLRLQQQIAQIRQSGSLFVRSPDQERERVRQWLEQYGCEIPEVGGVRTLCVRACDGYYFPISFSTSRQRMSRDAEVCQSMYGASGQAEIFAQGGGDVANAKSISGLRYGDQPYAFLFRQGYYPTCAQQLSDGMGALAKRFWGARVRTPDGTPIEIGITTEEPIAEERPFVMPMPTMRPLDLMQDPETVANRRGNLPVGPYVEDPAAVVATINGVRLIGDPYYADLFDAEKPVPAPPAHRGPLGFDLIGAAMAAETTGAGAPPEAIPTEIR